MINLIRRNTPQICALFVAILWGLAFVVLRDVSEEVSPLPFTAVRVLLGWGTITVVLKLLPHSNLSRTTRVSDRIYGGLICGTVLISGLLLQQYGLRMTTAGNSGLLTSMYVTLLPFIGVAFGAAISRTDWTLVALATLGVTLISAESSWQMQIGDLLSALGAVTWALLIWVQNKFGKVCGPLTLSKDQFLVAGAISLLLSFCLSEVDFDWSRRIWTSLLYGGPVSIGLGFTLQVVAVSRGDPVLTGVILSLEGVAAFIFGIILLKEPISGGVVFGSILILIAAGAASWVSSSK